jgi:hypothetical protein
MGREVRRVPLDFDWPTHKVWQGYIMPEGLREASCERCGGDGYSPEARHLRNLWYGYTSFRPEDNESTALTPYDLPVRAFAERNVARSPGYYGTGEDAVHREAVRLVDLWNGSWSNHLNAEDVAALIAADRLWDLTKTWTRGGGWQTIEPAAAPTPEQVNEWNLRGMGHDGINAHVVIRARAEREGHAYGCESCGGHGCVEVYPGQRADAEAWESADPPVGDGFQLWETVSEGSPISPVFATADGLVAWMSDLERGGDWVPAESAARFVADGWAPTFVGTAETGIVSGVEFVGFHADSN